MKKMIGILPLLFLLWLGMVPASSQTSRDDPDGWPEFHGKDRMNKSKGIGYLKQWPEKGPELLWTISGLGEGYASVSLAEGLLFTSGTLEGQTNVFAFDLNGKLRWRTPNGPAWKVEVSWARGYDGSRSTPTYDDGMVFHLSEGCRLIALDSQTGREIWSRNLMQEFDAPMPDYGFTESVLVDGDKLYVRPAGRKGFQLCLHKKTGETLWVNGDIPGTNSYSSAILTELAGIRQLVSNSSNCYYGLDPETGILLWKTEFANVYEVNATDPVVFRDQVFMSNGLGGGSELIRIHPDGSPLRVEKVWKTERMDNYHGGVIYHEGYLYGSGDRSRGWFCLDSKTGQEMWKISGSMGSLTFADGMLYLYEENGRMRLVKASPKGFEISGEFRVPRGGAGPFWAHPVVCGDRLYVRHADKVYAYLIK
ncbi:MAG: PQQ-binding-like beta-propeller repeat protein [Bacteroidales bacterium]